MSRTSLEDNRRSSNGEESCLREEAAGSHKYVEYIPLPVADGEISVIHLPRGGTYISTAVGPLQIGIPPETIKDSLALGLTMPQYYVMPPDSFHRELGSGLGINVAEFEFPAYYNFFLRKRTIKLVIGSLEIEQRLRIVLQETLFGPTHVDPDADFAPSISESERPNLLNESEYFRLFDGERLTLDSLVTFLHFNSNGMVEIPNKNDQGDFYLELRHRNSNGGEFIVDEVNKITNFRRRTIVSQFIELPDVLPFLPEPTNIVFEPPLFGVTVLGNSHGFDPGGSTSGYVLWINHRGYMIDPPPYASVILRNSNIRPSLIDGVIVTHCHADHDAGAFQKILFEGQITVITTRTIYGSFIRKYCALSGFSASLLRQTHRFLPVTIGETLRMRGASLNFFYTLHSIPCIGLEAYFGNRSIVFSADHMNDPDRIKKMQKENIISEGRCNFLLNFPWHHDVIFHEAGVPPIHTPIKTLAELPTEIKNKLYVVHVTPSSIPADSGLKIAPLGVQNTVVVNAPYPLQQHIVLYNLDRYLRSSSAIDALDLIASVGIFGHCSLTQARDLLELGIKKYFLAGSIIQEVGAHVIDICIVSSGQALVKVHSSKSYQRGSNSPLDHSAYLTHRFNEVSAAANGDNEPQRRKSVMDEVGSYYGSEDILGRGDWFGEESLIDTGSPSCHSVEALTDVEILTLSASDLKWVIGDRIGLGYRGYSSVLEDEDMRQFAIGRPCARRPRIDRLVARNCILRNMSRGQKLLLQSLLEARDLDAGDIVWTRGERMKFIVIVANGVLYFNDLKSDESIMNAAMDRYYDETVIDELGGKHNPHSGICSNGLKIDCGSDKCTVGSLEEGESRRRVRCPPEFYAGTLIGRPGALISAQGGRHMHTLCCKTTATILLLERDRMHYFSINNPGVFLSIHDLTFVA